MAPRLHDWLGQQLGGNWGDCSAKPTLDHRLDACAVSDEPICYRLKQLSASSASIPHILLTPARPALPRDSAPVRGRDGRRLHDTG
jgi:hypothetical protein